MVNALPKFGILDQIWAATDVSDADAISTALTAMQMADALGFDSVWVGEHHHRKADVAYWGRNPASEVLLAHAAALTKNIALGTGIRILSTTTALRAAEEMHMLSLLSGGRVDFGVGLGSHQNDNRTREERATLFRHLLDELLAILRDAPETGLPPLSPASPVDITKRIWAAARDETTLHYLAQAGINLVVGQAELGEAQADIIRQYKAAGGLGKVRGVRLMFVAPSHHQALQDCAAAADLYYSQMSKGGYHREAVEKGLIPETPANREEMLKQINFVVGTPEEVAAQLNDYLAITGVDQLDAMVQIPRIDPRHAHRSMALLQQEVRPLLCYQPQSTAYSLH